MLISDVVGHLGGIAGVTFYNPVLMLCVYSAMALSVVAGRWLGQEWHTGGAARVFSRVGAATLVSSTAFFMLSNFAVWVAWYPASLEGLVGCYVAALPFYGLTLLGDLAYSGIIFGGLYALNRRAMLSTTARGQADSAPAAC